MDAQQRNTSPFDLPANCFLKTWLILAIVFSVLLLGAFIFSGPLTEFGKVIWDFIRWLASPII